MNSDLLDEYCDLEFGHTDWAVSWDADGNRVITFHKEPTPEYLTDHEEDCPATDGFGCHCDEIMRPIRMRKDLAEEGITIPAGLNWSDYDNLEDVIHLSAEDLEGAFECDTGEDPDSHAFCPVKLRDGRVVYMIGVDLDWFSEEEV
jgi:hypothetical protein